ncbi:MAG TPA: bpX6 domain-containing protein, partial [Acidobacteriota bacterium]|nr:bpX6 domain-containing protein [Acidobacteriota bacterium]
MMTNSLYPRNLVHRGVVEAAGILIPINLCGVAEAQRRVIGHWETGARVFRVAGGYLVQFSASRLIDCRLADGSPVVALGKTLSTVPLTSQELKTLEPQPHSLITAQGGQIHIEPLAEQKLETISTWIDLSNFQAVEVTSLGSPPPAVIEAAPALAFDPRQQLDGVPPASPQMAEVIAALTRPVRVQSAPPSTATTSTQSQSPGFLARLLAQIKLLTTFLSSKEVTTSATARSNSAKSGSKTSPQPSALSARPWWRQLADTIGQLFGSKQSEPPDDQLRVLPPAPQSML